MLEESVSDHRHERVTMKALPGSSLEVVEAEFLSDSTCCALKMYRPSASTLCRRVYEWSNQLR